MRTVNFEFPYFHEDFGEEVVVEVEALLTKGVNNDVSDWDFRDHLEIVEVCPYFLGELLSIDIPEDVIYSEISSQIRDADITCAFNEECGGF